MHSDLSWLPAFVSAKHGLTAEVPVHTGWYGYETVVYRYAVIPRCHGLIHFCRTRSIARQLAKLCNGKIHYTAPTSAEAK